MGVKAKKWGPGAWKFLHFVTLLYPDLPTTSQKKAFTTLFRLLPDVLPCSICRKHLRNSYRALPPDLASRASAIRWFERVHTRVNLQLKKKVRHASVESCLRSITKHWKDGLRDLAFSIAFNAPRVNISNDVVHFMAACRKIAGKSSLPQTAHLKTKAGLLNTLTHFYGLSKPAVQAKYRPWLSPRSLASSNRVWPLTRQSSASARNSKKKSRRSRQPVVHLKIGL